MWDAVVVGAGPAGCAAAYDLAAAGRRVLLVDRAVFPRAKACAGGLTLKAIRALRYPVAPVVRRWVREIVLEEGAGSAVRVGRRSPVCAMTVRAELDSYCLEQTLARGVSFLRVGGLEAVEQGTDGVTLRFADAEGLTARFAVGADGVHSRMRALATDGSWFRSGFALEANVPYVEEGEQYPLCFDFAAIAGGYGWLFPRDNHVNVGLYTAAAGGSGQTGLDGAALERYIEARCGVGRAHGQVVGQFLGLGAARYQPKADARVLLVGDAAGCVDPLTGEGIYGAIRSGQAAAAAIDAALGAEGKSKERSGSGWLHASRLPGASGLRDGPGLPNGMAAAAGFTRELARLRADLRIAEHAAERFYAEPARGFALMRLPLMSRVVLRAYGEGLSLAGLLRVVRVAAGVRRHVAGRAG